MNLNNLPFRFESDVVRSLYRLTGERPSSEPYVSGDGFRSLCRRAYEGSRRARFDPLAVGENEIVYCEAWHLAEFLRSVAGSVPLQFSIISHNGDPNIDESILEILPLNVRHLFAQNVLFHNDRVTPLPIGLENRNLHCNGITADFDRLRRHAPRKRPRILTAFSMNNNTTARELAFRQLSATTLNDAVPRMNSRAYRNLAATYMFIASPPGNGVDCHRTWEAMYLGSVPIVLRSALTESFKERGLPLCIVDSYEEVAAWDEAGLCSRFEALSQRPGESLWFEYWRKVVHDAA